MSRARILNPGLSSKAFSTWSCIMTGKAPGPFPEATPSPSSIPARAVEVPGPASGA